MKLNNIAQKQMKKKSHFEKNQFFYYYCKR
jgi:hypothetical protein